MKDELIGDALIRHEVLGMELLLCPFAQHVSAQRAAMFAANLPQAVIVNGCEAPRISTGYENKFRDYSFNNMRRENDARIIDIVPQFALHTGASPIKTNPSQTVIYEDLKTGVVEYFEITEYTACNAGFGYRNKKINRFNLRRGNMLPKDMAFTEPISHDKETYAMGVNANVAFMTHPAVVQDAFVISDRLADKCEHYAINTTKINLTKDSIPLNIFGTGDAIKAMPDVGEQVGDTGLIMCVRELDDNTYLVNTTEEALSTPQPLHDDLFAAPTGATILDIKVYCPNNVYRQLSKNPGAYAQLLKYQEQQHVYYDTIVSIYYDLIRNKAKIGPKLANLVTRAMNLQSAKHSQGQTQFKLQDRRDNKIEFMQVHVTYGYNRKVSLGSKLVGRDGAL